MNENVNAILYSFSFSGQVSGNLISSTIFSQKHPENQNISEDVLAKCGAAYCPSDYQNNTNLDRPNMTKVFVFLLRYYASIVSSLRRMLCIFSGNISDSVSHLNALVRLFILICICFFIFK